MRQHQTHTVRHGGMVRTRKGLFFLALVTLLTLVLTLPAFAANSTDAPIDEAAAVETTDAAGLSDGIATAGKAVASGIAISIAAGLGALGMGLAVGKATDAISRQPEAEGKVRTTLMLGLVFIETAVIYALLAVILIIFVL